MGAHEQGQKPLTCLGIDLQRPADRTSPGKWPHIENIVGTVDGAPTPRPGLGTNAVATAPATETPWHSIRTLSDPTGGAGVWSRISGIGDRLCDERSSAPGTINNLLGGFSGNPLSLVPGRPAESPQPFMYVADSALMRKVDRAGNLKQIGLPAPAAPPTAQITSEGRKTIDLFEATTGWVAAGGAAAPTLLSAGPGRPVDTTTPATNGFVTDGNLKCIAATSMANIVAGSVLTVQNALMEDVRVLAVHSGSAAIAITGILYDSGTTGKCSISLASPVPQIEVNSLLLVTGVASAGTELVRVIDVLYGTDGSVAVRTSTAVARLATDTITATPSFDCFMALDPTAGGTIRSDGIRSVIAAAVPGPTPATLSKVITLDLSQLAGGSSGTSSTLDDYVSILIRSNTAVITEIRLMFDCDINSVVAGAFTASAFTRNYYLKVITQSDLQALLDFKQTAVANRQEQILRDIISSGTELPAHVRGPGIGPGGYGGPGGGGRRAPTQDDPGFNFPRGIDVTRDPASPTEPPRTQIEPGLFQWSTIRFRLREMERIGTDRSRGFRDVVGVRIAILTSAAVDIDLDAWVLHGGYEPDVGEVAQGYEYRYYGYDSATGVRSNTSPASIGLVRASRQNVLVTLTQHPSAECDRLGIERRGGNVPGWHWIGSTANLAFPVFTDGISNLGAFSIPESEPSGLNYCQPWPLPQKPLTGSSAVVSGTLIYDSTAPFSLSWLRGSYIQANGQISILRRVLSTSMIEVEDSMGNSASASWEITRPVLAGQPLPILFGGGDWDENRVIALGDPADPSAYYVSRRSNYDATTEMLRFEIPGAVLQNGCVWNGSPYIWSTEHLYRIESAGLDAQGNLLLRHVIVSGTRGLISRWACCAGDRMYWLDREGICASGGGEPSILTDDDLYPLFPHGGVAGTAVNGINPPNLASGQEASLRLSYGGDKLRFLYVDSGSTRRELELRMRKDAPSGWYPHVYTPGVASAYYEEGPGKRAWLMGGADATTAKLYLLTDAQSDGGTAIVASGTPQYENVGDPRSRKRWGDYSTEVDRDGATVSVTPKFDNGATAATLVSLTTGTGRVIRMGDLGTTPAGSGVLATNMSLAFSMSVTTERPKLYTWEPTWLARPLVTQLRATDFEDASPQGPKFVRGVWVVFDSLGGTRAASVYRDGNLTTAVTTITGITSSSGPKRQFFPFTTPFYASTLLLLPTDAASWMLFGVEWLADPAPELSTEPQPWSDLGYAGAKWIQGVILDGDTEGATVSVAVDVDENVLQTTITGVTHTGRAQKAYTFDPPFLTHLVRPRPVTAMRLWPTPPTRWVWEPEPELGEHYETQQTTHDIPEVYKILRDAQITLRSTSVVTFSIYDGSLGTGSAALFSTTIPSTAGLRKSVYVPITAVKAKSLIYVLDGAGTGFALYRRDSWVRVRGWGRTVAVLGGEQASNWTTALPFGADHRICGAEV